MCRSVALVDPQQALAAIDALGQPVEEILKLVDRERPLALERQRLETIRRHVIVGVIVRVTVGVPLRRLAIARALPGLRVLLIGEESIRLEQADAEDERERKAALRGLDDPRALLDPADAALDRPQTRRVDQVALVEQHHVAVAQLIARGLALEQIEAEAAGVRDGDDRIDAGELPELRAQEGQHHRQRIGEPGGLDHEVVDPAVTGENPEDRIDEIVVDRAADAAVFQLHHVVVGGDDQLAVDAEFAELVDDDGGAQSVLVGEDVLHQRGFSAAEKAGDDGHGQARLGRMGGKSRGRGGGHGDLRSRAASFGAACLSGAC